MAPSGSQNAHTAVTHLGVMCLSFGSGSTDVLAFLGLGNVFTSAMTGNTALLAIALGQGQWVTALQPAVALLGFVGGAALASVLYDPNWAKAHAMRAVRPLFFVEIASLGCFALIWGVPGHTDQSATLYGLIVLSAIGMGIQGVAARHINFPGIATIVFTSTLVSVAMSVSTAFMRSADNSGELLQAKRQTGTVLAYGFGAALAALLLWRGVEAIAWIPCAAVLCAFGFCELARQREESAS